MSISSSFFGNIAAVHFFKLVGAFTKKVYELAAYPSLWFPQEPTFSERPSLRYDAVFSRVLTRPPRFG